MIDLKATTIRGLPLMLQNIETLDVLIKKYKTDRIDVAYFIAKYVSGGVEFQLDKQIVIAALETQREAYIRHLNKFGINLVE